MSLRYASFDDLAQAAPNGWQELAELGRAGPGVTASLMEAAAVGEDLSGWDPAQVDDALRALARLADALDRSSRHADSYLVPRYGHRLPAEVIAASDLPGAVATLALRRLYGHTASDALRKATEWADRYLVDLSAGRASIGTPGVQETDPETRYDFSARAASDAALTGYR